MLVSLFSDIMPGFEGMIDDLFGGEITEDDCNLVAALSQIGNEVAMPLLYYILSLGYADEVLDTEPGVYLLTGQYICTEMIGRERLENGEAHEQSD